MRRDDVWGAVTELATALEKRRELHRADLLQFPRLAAAAVSFRASQLPSWSPPLWPWAATPEARWPLDAAIG